MGQARCLLMTELIAQGANVNALGAGTMTTPLFDACKHGHVEAVALLLQHKAKPNIACGRAVRSRYSVALGAIVSR